MRAWCFRLSSLFAALSLLAFAASVAFADQTVRVELADFSFKPNAFSAQVGEKVTFQTQNVGQRPHDIHIEGPGGFVWEMVDGAGSVAAGQSSSGTVTFTAPGDYQVWCPVGNHRAQGMVGTFKVAAVGTAAATAAPSATLPRTGEPTTLIGTALAALGALSFAGGLVLRRR